MKDDGLGNHSHSQAKPRALSSRALAPSHCIVQASNEGVSTGALVYAHTLYTPCARALLKHTHTPSLSLSPHTPPTPLLLQTVHAACSRICTAYIHRASSREALPTSPTRPGSLLRRTLYPSLWLISQIINDKDFIIILYQTFILNMIMFLQVHPLKKEEDADSY